MVVKKEQIKTIMGWHFTSTRMVLIEKERESYGGKDEKRNPFTLWWECKTLKNSLVVLQLTKE